MTTLLALGRAALVLAVHLTPAEAGVGLALAGLAVLVFWGIDRAGRGPKGGGR